MKHTLIFFAIFAAVSLHAQDELVLSSFENEDEWINLQRETGPPPFTSETSPEKIKRGEASGKWSNLLRNKWLRLANTPRDWSDYEAISVWIYSTIDNGQKINLVAYAEPRDPNESKLCYFQTQVTVDWTGWKQVVIPFSEFMAMRGPLGWEAITNLRLTAGGWKAEPLDDSELYLDDLKLITR